jgi:Brp/Blh family beta-carotene 15,15'-monooxygenase
MPVFIFGYLTVGALMALIWFLSPSIGLTLFLTYSSWHFGQADGALWKLNSITSLLWGLSVLTILLGSHLDETNEILYAMGTAAMPIETEWWMLIPWTLWFLAKRQPAGAITTIWIMLCCHLPLPLAFGIYFIGQHSITGWMHIKAHLQMSSKAIWLHSLPFHAGAWLLLVIFYLVYPSVAATSATLWGTFFIFLACLSLPHVLTMNKVYRK